MVLFAKWTNVSDESGYSLMEVIAAIMLLSIAIVPMVGMFDAGLRAVGTSGDYDRARSLANLKLEEAKSLPYASSTATNVKDDFPVAGSSTPDSAGYYGSQYLPPEAALETEFAGFEYKVEKQYLTRPDSTASAQNFTPHDTDDAGLMKVTVAVRWNDSSTYSASGVIAR